MFVLGNNDANDYGTSNQSYEVNLLLNRVLLSADPSVVLLRSLCSSTLM